MTKKNDLSLYSTDALVKELTTRHDQLVMVALTEVTDVGGFSLYRHGSHSLNISLLEMGRSYIVDEVKEICGPLVGFEPDFYGPDVENENEDRD